MNGNSLRSVVEARKNGKPVSLSSLAAAPNMELAAVLSKLVRNNVPPTHDSKGNREIELTDQHRFATASQEISQKSEDADITLQLFPEMELARQIMVSSVISPKDMQSTDLNFTAPETLKTAPISAPLLEVVKKYFKTDYRIEPLMPEILNDMLFGSGSYPLAVIPENSVDELINGTRNITMESLRTEMGDSNVFSGIGLLGPCDLIAAKDKSRKHNFSLEDFVGSGSIPFAEPQNPVRNQIHYTVDESKVKQLTHVVVTDNFNALKLPSIIATKRNRDVERLLDRKRRKRTESFGNESVATLKGKTISDVELTQLFFKNSNTRYKTIRKVKTDGELARRTIGAPLTMRLPSESVIPVCVPGDNRRHVGYFVLLDSEGNPVSRKSRGSEYNDLRNRFSGNQDMSSTLLGASSSINGNQCRMQTFDQAAKVYSEIVEADLLARLRNGVIGQSVEFGTNQDFYTLMLARAMKQQLTQILYLPADLMTYFAYKYDDNGIGKSLLDDMRILNALRSMLLFAQVQADVKNSIGRTTVNLKLSDVDPNPQKTIEVAMHEVMQARSQNTMPFNRTTPSDLTRWVSTAGVEFQFEGHPALPDTKIEFSEHNTNYVKQDSGLEEQLRKRAIMGTGLSPETVDNGFASEHATTVVANNVLLSKRVQQIQDIFVPLITDHCRKQALNDGNLFEEIRKTIEENFQKLVDVIKPDEELMAIVNDQGKETIIHYLTVEFLSNFETSLSRPDVISLQNQMEAFNKQRDAYIAGIDYYINANILPESLMGEQSGQRVDEIKEIVLATLMRRWMARENILPELAEMTQTTEDGQPLIDFGKDTEDHMNAMNKSIVHLVTKMVPVAQAANRDIEKATQGEELGESSVTASTPSDSGGGGSDTGGLETGLTGDAGSDEGGSDTGGGDDLGNDLSIPGL
jgi:hypothetical protein